MCVPMHQKCNPDTLLWQVIFIDLKEVTIISHFTQPYIDYLCRAICHVCHRKQSSCGGLTTLVNIELLVLLV